MRFHPERIDGVPVLVGCTRRAGEALADGLLVPSGSLLLGEPLTLAHPLSDVRRWTADLLVLGSVRATIDDLVEQLLRRGLRVALTRSEPPVGAPEGATAYRISGVADEVPGRRCLVAGELVQAPSAPDDLGVESSTIRRRPSTSFLHLEVTTERPGSPSTRDWGSTIPSTRDAVEDRPGSGEWPELPGPGEPLLPAPGWWGADGLDALSVPADTSPVGPPAGPRTVLVRPRGRVARSFDDLVAQARQLIGPEAMVTRAPDARADGARVRFAVLGRRSSGPVLLVRAVERTGRPGYLVVTLTTTDRE